MLSRKARVQGGFAQLYRPGAKAAGAPSRRIIEVPTANCFNTAQTNAQALRLAEAAEELRILMALTRKYSCRWQPFLGSKRQTSKNVT
jgi:hypothetical protein